MSGYSFRTHHSHLLFQNHYGIRFPGLPIQSTLRSFAAAAAIARRTRPIPSRTRKLSAGRRQYPSGQDRRSRFHRILKACSGMPFFCSLENILGNSIFWKVFAGLIVYSIGLFLLFIGSNWFNILRRYFLGNLIYRYIR